MEQVPEVYLPDKVKEDMVLGDPLTVMERVEVLSIIRKVNSSNTLVAFFNAAIVARVWSWINVAR